MTFKIKEYSDIFLEALQDALKQGLISHQEEFEQYIKNKQDISNFYVMLLSVHAEVFAEVYRHMQSIYDSTKINSAEDRDLDDLGKIINCTRPASTKSTVELTFTIPHMYDKNTNEPAGIRVATKNGIMYETVEPLNFTNEIHSCTVQAFAVKPGSSSRVIENTLTKIESNLKNITSAVSVTNQKASIGGSDGFNDEQYRKLLKNWVKTKQRGNEWAYKEYFSRIDGVEDYKLVANWDGTGTIKVIISPSSSYFLNKVYDELQSEVTQMSEDIVVLPPIDKKIDLFVECNVDIDRINPYSATEKEVIKSKIEEKIKIFIENLKIGEDFIPHKLAVFVDENINELKNIEFNYPTKPVLVNDEEKCVLGDVEVLME